MHKFDELLYNNMTERGLQFWKKLDEKIPNVWNRLSSSSKKYHKRDNGEVDTIEEHTYEMLYCCIKIMSIFDIQPKTKDCDLILISILLHDSCKYGLESPLERLHTEKTHDRIIGNLVNLSRNTFLKYFSNDEVYLIEGMTRFHSGRWSTDADNDFSFKKLDPKILLIHFLDMCSAKNILKIPTGDNK